MSRVETQPGLVFELNNASKHTVYNGWDRPRIHLILDYVDEADAVSLPEPTVLAPGTGRIPLGPAGAGRTASKSWWGPGVGALVVILFAVVGIAMLQREEEPGPEQGEQPSEAGEVVPGPRKQPPTPAPGATQYSWRFQSQRRTQPGSTAGLFASRQGPSPTSWSHLAR